MKPHNASIANGQVQDRSVEIYGPADGADLWLGKGELRDRSDAGGEALVADYHYEDNDDIHSGDRRAPRPASRHAADDRRSRWDDDDENDEDGAEARHDRWRKRAWTPSFV